MMVGLAWLAGWPILTYRYFYSENYFEIWKTGLDLLIILLRDQKLGKPSTFVNLTGKCNRNEIWLEMSIK